MNTTIILYRSDLLDIEACEPGLALYDELAAAQGDNTMLRIPMAGLLWASCDERTRKYLRWAQAEGLLPLVSAPSSCLMGADLKRAELAIANLAYADLKRADLTGANLTGANLTGANLTGADLPRAYLPRANLTDASLTDASLTGANLTGANLTGANLTGANLTGANLTGANLTDANLARANLTGALRRPSDPPIAGWVLRDGVLVSEVSR